MMIKKKKKSGTKILTPLVRGAHTHSNLHLRTHDCLLHWGGQQAPSNQRSSKNSDSLLLQRTHPALAKVVVLPHPDFRYFQGAHIHVSDPSGPLRYPISNSKLQLCRTEKCLWLAPFSLFRCQGCYTRFSPTYIITWQARDHMCGRVLRLM